MTTTEPTAEPTRPEVMAVSAPAEVFINDYDEYGTQIEVFTAAPEHWDERIWHRRGGY